MLSFGVIFGIQFFLWTIGVYFFSWNSSHAMYGEFVKEETLHLPANISLVSPDKVLEEIKLVHRADSITSFRLINLLGRPIYQVSVLCILQNDTDHGHHLGVINYLINADSGCIRKSVTKDEAIAIAKLQYHDLDEVDRVEMLTAVDRSHPYNGNPLPAYALTLEKSETTVYIASELGTVQVFRNETKRPFDWSWKKNVLETQKENFIKRIIISFLLVGLITIVSGLIVCVWILGLIKKL